MNRSEVTHHDHEQSEVIHHDHEQSEVTHHDHDSAPLRTCTTSFAYAHARAHEGAHTQAYKFVHTKPKPLCTRVAGAWIPLITPRLQVTLEYTS
jgi:hypothetical protein